MGKEKERGEKEEKKTGGSREESYTSPESTVKPPPPLPPGPITPDTLVQILLSYESSSVYN